MNSDTPTSSSIWQRISRALSSMHGKLPDHSPDHRAMQRSGFKLFLHGVVVSFETGSLQKSSHPPADSKNPTLPPGP